MKEYTVKVYDDRTEWRLDELLHREDGPAVEYQNGTKIWYKHGKTHREDGPAIDRAYGNKEKEWWRHGKLHREDGPAIEYADGDKSWCQNGNYHREDGPAVERVGGHKEWYQHGKFHRVDGPAVEWANGQKEWWLNGKQVTEEEHRRLTSSNNKELTEEEYNENQMDVFEKELERLINKHSVENVIDMPDYLLAEMIRRMVEAIGPSIKRYIRDSVAVNEIETPNKEDELLICRKLLLELVETCPIHFKYDDPDYSESRSRYLTALINGQRYLASSY